MREVYFGVVGTNGSGKSEVCNYLSQKGFFVFSLSDIVRIAASKKKRALTRDNLITTGNELKRKFGNDILAKMSYDKAVSENKSLVVFDSIRHKAEAIYLKDRGCKIIGVDAPLEVRYARIKQRKKETDKVDFKAFKRQDEEENMGKNPGQNIFQTLKECELIINNKGSIDDLRTQIDKHILLYQDK